MYKILLLAVVLLFSACSNKTAPKPSEKAFEEEDTYILFALRAEQVGSFKTAAKLFEELYARSQKKEYIYRALQDMYLQKDYVALLHRVDTLLKESPDDVKFLRTKIVTLLALKKYAQAEKMAVALAKKTQDAKDYILVSDVYIKSHQYDTALRYLESAYMKNYDEEILDKMAILLYVNLERKKDAIAKLETHVLLHGCSKLICNRLIGIYSNENNIEGLLSVYKRLYEQEKESDIAKKIIQIYGYKRDYLSMIDFLKSSGEDDELLLELYLSQKRFSEASELALKLYKKTGNYEYLGQHAIYMYEAKGKNVDDATLQKVVEILKEVVEHSENLNYKNYLGYILIDHNKDVKTGMKYIKEVVAKEPKSAYFLDSLAWGYYRLGECKKAYKIITEAQNYKGGDDPEVLLHVKKIQECLAKNKTRGKK